MLDLGSGAGWHFRVVGLDAAAGLAALAKSRRPGADIRLGEIEAATGSARGRKPATAAPAGRAAAARDRWGIARRRNRARSNRARPRRSPPAVPCSVARP